MIKMTNKLEGLLQELKKASSETFYHSLRTKRFTNQMILLTNTAGVTDYSPDEIDYICKGAMLHDIGKLKVTNFILTKDKSLSSEEMDDMRKHPRFSWEMIKNEIYNEEAEIIKNICCFHHERIDGTGYEGMTEIPMYVQIVSVCDAFDALHSDRIYHEGFNAKKALQMIENGDCGMFDKRVVDFMAQVAKDLECE